MQILCFILRDSGEDSDEDTHSASQNRSRSPIRWPSSDTREKREDRRWPHDRGGERDDRRYHRNGKETRKIRGPFKPDHVVNPSKWTKYDLAEDGTKQLRKSGMSAEQVNKYAAFEFLNELKNKEHEHSNEENQTKDAEIEGKMVFKKPTRNMVKESAEKRMTGGDGGFGGGAGLCVMPEYVVGGEKAADGKMTRQGRKQLTVLGGKTGEREDKEKRTGGKEKKSSQCVNLSHLEDDELGNT